MRIDEQTANKIRTVIMLARARGQDPVAALDLGGFLRHEATIKQDRIAGINVAINTILAVSAAMLLSHHELPRTPLDLKKFILDLLRSIREGM